MIKIGSQIGAVNTVVLVIATAVLGAMLARMEGLRTLQQIQSSLARAISRRKN